MKRALLLAAAATVFAAPVAAMPIETSISRGDATSIRSCQRDFGGAFNSVCFNRVYTIGLGPLNFEKERVGRVRCDLGFWRTGATDRGSIAQEFCPQVEAGTLAPAPFLQ